MSLSRYRYRHNGHGGTLYMGQERHAYLFETEDGGVYPLALDDLIQLDTLDAAFRAQTDALVDAWRERCHTAATLLEPKTARQTLNGCLDMMERATNDQVWRRRQASEHATATRYLAQPGVRHTRRYKP